MRAALRRRHMNTRGLLTCARYAFAPNYLKYCGPDEHRTIFEYCAAQDADAGLRELLEKFGTLYPYLRFIAQVNGIEDPFDPRVVEAYWIGNKLLKSAGKAEFAGHLIDTQQLKKRLNPKSRDWLLAKIPQGAHPVHAFHVFNVFTRTGHHTLPHTVDTMDQCRIGWGRILYRDGEFLVVQARPLVLENGKLALGKPKERLVRAKYRNTDLPVYKKAGQWVSFHWGWVCNTLTDQQRRTLAHYTLLNMQLANKTI